MKSSRAVRADVESRHAVHHAILPADPPKAEMIN
jgi:hypothetical protein